MRSSRSRLISSWREPRKPAPKLNPEDALARAARGTGRAQWGAGAVWGVLLGVPRECMKGTVICGEEEVKMRSSGEQEYHWDENEPLENRKYNQSTLVVFLRHFWVGLLSRLPPPILALLASLPQIQIRIPNLASSSSGFMKNDNDNSHFTTTITPTSPGSLLLIPPPYLPPFLSPPIFQRRNTTRRPPIQLTVHSVTRQTLPITGKNKYRENKAETRAPSAPRAAAGASRLRIWRVLISTGSSHTEDVQPHSHPSSAPHSSEAAADEHDLEAPTRAAQAPQTQPPMQNEQRHTPPPHRPRLAHTRELRLSSSRLGFIFVRG
ncbi:hypothetical protein B0H13DRAFT_2552212 [Mycena leptocephala]|nr:hypothetical protein B0H13DRAFT_2552212 [Mycena leptocephala]